MRRSVPSPSALVVNYPSNPTAHTVGRDFYREVVAFARKHEIWVLSDLAYADIYFGEPPPSILEIDGAKDVAVEFQSLSKTYAMPGWRMGFAAGNARLIGALARIKSYLDYGAYTPIQVAASAALNGPQDCVDEIRAIYRSRRDVLVDSLARAGWPIASPDASMFAWAEIRKSFAPWARSNSPSNCSRTQRSPWRPVSVLASTAKAMRIALVENEHRIRQAARNIKRFLSMRINEPADALEPVK